MTYHPARVKMTRDIERSTCQDALVRHRHLYIDLAEYEKARDEAGKTDASIARELDMDPQSWRRRRMAGESSGMINVSRPEAFVLSMVLAVEALTSDRQPNLTLDPSLTVLRRLEASEEQVRELQAAQAGHASETARLSSENARLVSEIETLASRLAELLDRPPSD